MQLYDVRGNRMYGAWKRKWSMAQRAILLFVVSIGLMSVAAVTQIDLTTQVKNILPVANGGTNAATFSAHYFFGNSTGSTAAPAPGLIGTQDSSPQWYVTGAGSGTAFTATLAPAVASLVAGLDVRLLSGSANSGTAPTLAVNGLTAKTITKCGATALVANDINTSSIADLLYDGTEFQLLNPQVIPCGTILTGTFVDDETPSGSLPGTALTLAHAPNPAASLLLFYNGQKLEPGGLDYTLSGTGITLAATAPSGTVFAASYRY